MFDDWQQLDMTACDDLAIANADNILKGKHFKTKEICNIQTATFSWANGEEVVFDLCVN